MSRTLPIFLALSALASAERGILDLDNTTFDKVATYLDTLGMEDSETSRHQRRKLEYLLRTDMFMSLKNMYRASMLTFPTYCDQDTPFTYCHGTCADLAQLERAVEVGHITFVNAYWESMFSWADAASFAWLTPDVKVHIIREVCDLGVGVDGDHLESGSPMDPSFWPIHPTMERLWAFKKLTGTFFDEAWPRRPGDYAEVGGCYGHSWNSTVPFAFALKTSGAEPSGAAAGDPTSSTPLTGFNGSAATRLYTTNEIMQLASPESDSMPYVYADFAWEHCASAGWDFASLMASAHSAAADDEAAGGQAVSDGGSSSSSDSSGSSSDSSSSSSSTDGASDASASAQTASGGSTKATGPSSRARWLREFLREESLPSDLRGV